MSEKQKMLAGEWFLSPDFELSKIHMRTQDYLQQYNGCQIFDFRKRAVLLHRMLNKVGPGTVVESPFYVDYGVNVTLGENVYINVNCTLTDGNTITVGNGVFISPGVQILTTEHPLTPSERSRIVDGKFKCVMRTRPVEIGDNVWIGAGAIILPGVSVGRNSVIGAGSVVTKPIPENVVAVGNPCRVVRSLPVETEVQHANSNLIGATEHE
ncbi:sugar O-acetyltransferase [Hahella ganghwensis]|uniref:sugar O-acetyltransferase n=1 Tax=Hahella ganghwensis TaxID=286420 RepID=UPI00037C51B2|nr:sugar O-acetyltransferase [Hahella ganghwensis]